MPRALPLTTLPTATLHERSVEVAREEIGTPEFQRWLDDVIETMFAANGVGIAAAQVGRNIRVFVVNDRGRGVVYINPTVELLSGATEESEEGCLSVPGVYGIVKRAKKIRVTAQNRHGRTETFVTKGFPAIVFQHEMDHLNGILYVDKVERYTKERKTALG